MGENIAFIGLGAMGGPMAQNIIRKGTKVSVYDIDKTKMDPIIEVGGTPGRNIKETIENADIIITMLPSTENVKSVMTDNDGVLSFVKPNAIILDMSTIAPTGTDEIYKLCKENDLQFIDAPVGRLVSHAISGDSLFMVGCDNEEAFKKIEPLLNAMGTTIIRCGKVGSGIRAKVVNNFQILSIAQITAEALTLAQKIGLDLDVFKEVNAGTTANNGQFHINFLSKVLKNDIEPGFTIDLAHKDMGLAIETANSFRVGLPVGSAVQAVYGQARSGKFAKKDFSALLDYACELAEIDPPRVKKS
ncbi:NAD(P)-dependent oxidoreductase [Alphaproteobacteria bacterium]|jgi:4-hydroxybutyrate dehydrogenase/sulfolactaldehyde 3-reductase|nr:NAD(P)-dependent oxidoreductase [Alphaproteobacteria bacterium]MDB9870738.1 NAD(P)-dependent oxidoreductase [Alphaproteobacteria bacterium]